MRICKDLSNGNSWAKNYNQDLRCKSWIQWQLDTDEWELLNIVQVNRKFPDSSREGKANVKYKKENKRHRRHGDKNTNMGLGM
jgi:hypothetical protein